MHIRVDSIEQSLRDLRADVQGEGYAAARAIAEDNLRLGRTVIADSVNPWPLTRNEWRAVAGRAGVPVFDVEVVCSDANEHRRRVESRVADIPNHLLPTWSQVTERDYRPWEGADRLVIDSSRLDVQQSVDAILSALTID